MNTNDTNQTQALHALSLPDASNRLTASLHIGTHAGVWGEGSEEVVGKLIERAGVEPDFFVRDMLTWALTRFPVEVTVPALLAELTSETAQARCQALHTMSKIGTADAKEAERFWRVTVPDLLAALIADPEDAVALAAWRAAVALAPRVTDQQEWLASNLAGQLGRGDREMWLSLSRAFAALDEAVAREILGQERSGDAAAHADATVQLLDDPDAGFVGSGATHAAKRAAALGPHAVSEQ